MNLVFQNGYSVALLLLASAVILAVIVVFVLRSEDPLGDEMAQCVRQSAELLDTCSHSLDERPTHQVAFGDLSGGRWRTPARRLQLSHPSGEPAGATHT